MSVVTARILCYFILISIVSINLIIFYPNTNTQIYPAGVAEDQFRSWFEKKQELKENIARVCKKYEGYIDKISGRVLDKTMFLHFDKMVICLIQKVAKIYKISI